MIFVKIDLGYSDYLHLLDYVSSYIRENEILMKEFKGSNSNFVHNVNCAKKFRDYLTSLEPFEKK